MAQLPLPVDDFLHVRRKSLTRGNLLVLASTIGAAILSDFPHNRPTLWQIVPFFLAVAGTADTVRCIRRRWSFYHAGVILCIYMDLLALCVILFFLLYPFAHFIAATS